MNLGELIKACRLKSGDTGKPFFWSDPEWIAYLNEAVSEACIRARLIVSDDIEIDLCAGEAYADYPCNVWSIRRVQVPGRKSLSLVDREMLDSGEVIGWMERTGDPIACYEIDGRLRLYPIPESNEIAIVEAFCTPKRELSQPTDKPEIHDRLHMKLIDWALHRAFSKIDADTFDPGRASAHEGEFEKTFGPRPDETKMRRMRINVVRRVVGHSF